MNKQELRGLPDGDRGLDILENYFPEARIAIVKECPVSVVLQDYFDIIISDNIAVLAACTPDIFVYRSAQVDEGGQVILPTIMDGVPDSLLVVNKEAVKKLKSLKSRPKNYILQAKSEECGSDLPIKIAKLIGATDAAIWQIDSLGLSSLSGTNSTNEGFYLKKDKYGVPVNIIKKKRPLLMQGW